MVKSENAVVFRCSDGKRYFTKKAALKHEAIKKLCKRNDMGGCHDELVNGEHKQTCFYTDEQWQLFQNIAARYYRRFKIYVK